MLKVLSYNIREDGTGRLSSIADLIGGQRPDVVAVLEANQYDNALSLAKALGMDCAFGLANSAFHIAWLSRLPIREQRNHRFPTLAKTLLEIVVPWEGSAFLSGSRSRKKCSRNSVRKVCDMPMKTGSNA